MKSLTGEITTVPQDAILEHLRKILSSQSFQGAERSAKLLRFLVEQTVSGQSDRLKEYTLATEALGKGSSFDPRTDTIVRAEVSRLRNRLDRYYASEGRTDSLIIALSKGSYVPRFQERILPQEVGALGGGKTSLPARVTRVALAIGLVACVFAVVVVWGLSRVPVPDDAVSIAVLPFANLSADPEQEFFSDGMTDEISGVLAKVPDLRVIARSSAFQFKGQNQDVRAVGQALGASHLIEGSVRQAGNRVRITAQLVRAGDGVQLWSENYDRELIDIFAIQEQIAEAIAGALRSPLGLQRGERLVSNRTNDLASYRQFLRARALLRARSIDATAILEPLVARDPGYAPAWAQLSQAYSLAGFRGTIARAGGPIEEARHFTQSWLDKAEEAAREAIRLDPQYASGYTQLGAIQSARGKWADSEDLLRQALALDPNDPETLDIYARRRASAGHLKESLGLREQLHTLEPFVPIFNVQTASIMIASGQNEAAIRVLKTVTPDETICCLRDLLLAHANAAEGRYGDAADALLAIPQQDRVSLQSIEDAARLVRTARTKADSPDALPALLGMGFVYAYVGAPVRVLDDPERLVEIGFSALEPSLIWQPEFAVSRKTERFKALMRKAGLVDYWRARGWPDLCRPLGADDFVCD